MSLSANMCECVFLIQFASQSASAATAGLKFFTVYKYTTAAD